MNNVIPMHRNNHEPSPETLAVKLVDRGLCSQNIQERPYKPNRSE